LAAANGGRTFTGNPVWKDAVFFVAPGGGVVNWFTAAAALGLVVLLVQRRVRVAAVLVLTIAAPVVFFTVVPTNGLSAALLRPVHAARAALVPDARRDRVQHTCRLAWRVRLVAVAALVAALMSVGLRIVLARQTQLAHLGLGQLTTAVRDQSRNTVLFGSTGFTLPGGYLGYFTFGRPPNLADRYLSLRIPSLQFVNDDSCAPVVDFLAKGEPPQHGLWVFWAVQPDDQRKAEAAFAHIRGIDLTEPFRHFLVVRSTQALPPLQLVELGLELRRTWFRAVPFNRRVNLLITADRVALHDPSVVPAGRSLGRPGQSSRTTRCRQPPKRCRAGVESVLWCSSAASRTSRRAACSRCGLGRCRCGRPASSPSWTRRS